MKISAVIFDLNGTILDDEGNYNIAFNKVLKRLGVDTSKEIPHERGIGVKENWEIYLNKFSIKTNKLPEVLALETQEEYLKILDTVRIREGFEDFASGLKDSGVKIALATSNTWEVTMKILEKMDLTEMFDAITTAEEVVFNKPDPQIFIVTADKLGIEEMEECLVVEDAPSGVVAAHEAGMKVIALSTDEKLSESLDEADLTLESFSEITVNIIDQL